jgi:hypothetical protein
MHSQRLIALTVCLALCATIPGRAQQPSDPGEAVRSAFSAYKAAILSGSGAAALELVSQSTVSYYREMQQLALYAEAAQVRARSIVDRTQILTMRHRVDPHVLRRMSPRDLFVYAVNQGWVGKESVARLEAGAARVWGATATVEIIRLGNRTGLQYPLTHERGRWRVDLVPTLDWANSAMGQLARRQGVSEDQLILTLLQVASGRPVPEGIWDPPFPRPR